MPNSLSQFRQELKHRKVTRTITAYAAAALVILELFSTDLFLWVDVVTLGYEESL